MKARHETAAKKILIIYAHPRKTSLNNAVKESVIRGLKKFEVDIRVQDLYKEAFDPVLVDIKADEKKEIIIKMKENIRWADWLLFIAPMWWANTPAILKGYFDRIFTENFAFRYTPAGIPEGLLGDKKALLLGTCDTPPLILRLAGRTSGFKSVIKGVLRLCGVKDAKYLIFGSVLNSSKAKRVRWLKRTEKIGERISRPQRALFTRKRMLTALLKAMRLPLYSFVFFPIMLGASVGASSAKMFNLLGFVLATLIGIFAHAAVSFSNEAADELIDRNNSNRTMFSGGTGLLAKGYISKRALNIGWIISSTLALLISAALVFIFQYHYLLIVSLGLGLTLGLGYNFKPLQLSRKGLGEFAAFIAYGVPLLMVGVVLQSIEKDFLVQIIDSYRFYLLALPVSISITVTLCLTQIPDIDADISQGKRSVAVLIGPKKVMFLSAYLQSFGVLSFVSFVPLHILPWVYALIASLLPGYTLLKILTKKDSYKEPAGMAMTGIMGISVISSISSALVPTVYFLARHQTISLFR